MITRKILTTIDIDGEINENAIRYSIDLAKIFGAKIIFLHTYEIPYAYPIGEASGWVGYPGVPTESDRDLLKEVAEEKGNQFTSLIEKIPEMASIPYEYLSQAGLAEDVISDEASEFDADLIVMGTSEALDIDVFIGTVAETVTRKSTCPVIVIPKNYVYEHLKRVCLAIDPERTIQEADLSILLQMVKAYNIGLDIVHVHTDNDIQIDESKVALLELLKEQMKRNNIAYSFHALSSENVEQGIIEFNKRNQIDLLALVYREHGFFKRMFDPGLRKKMVSESETPILILK